MSWWKKAFAVDPPGPAEPDDEQRRAIDFFCAEIVRRHLTTPAIGALEMGRPLNFIFAQSMHFLQPAANVIFGLFKMIAKKPERDSSGIPLPDQPHLTTDDWNPIARFLERRGSIDYICRRIEHFEAEIVAKERVAKALRKEEKKNKKDKKQRKEE